LNIRITPTVLLIAACIVTSVRAEDRVLPDPKLTPGRVAHNRKDRGRVTEEMERHVFALYQIPWRRRSEFKVDHLIPTELGGADTIDNLWPQSLSVRPYHAKRKEYLTQRLLARIAAGEITLARAQKEIREDWISCFVDHVGLAHFQ
jgi:hypothetical protein